MSDTIDLLAADLTDIVWCSALNIAGIVDRHGLDTETVVATFLDEVARDTNRSLNRRAAPVWATARHIACVALGAATLDDSVTALTTMVAAGHVHRVLLLMDAAAIRTRDAYANRPTTPHP